MAEEQDIDVTVEEEIAADESVTTKVEPDKTEAKTDDKPKAAEPVADLAVQLKELEAQAEKDRDARLAAERRYRSALTERDRATSDAQSARADLADREADSILAGLSAAQSEAASAETEYKAAFESGDAAALATAQRKMARAEGKTLRFEEAKADLDSRATRRQPERRADDQRTDETRTSDLVETYIQGRTEATANWLRSHKEWITDARKNAKLTAAHYSAMADGVVPDSDEYFSHVETFIGLRKSDEAKSSNGAAKPRRQTPSVAPVQASGGGTSGSGGNEVRLTKGEAQAAVDGTHTWSYDDPSPQKKFKKGDVLGVQEFARRKLAMTKQGLYDKSFNEG